MPYIDPKETDAMKRLMQIMNGGSPSAPAPSESAGPILPVTESSHPNPDVGAMKTILEKFYGASTNAARSMAEEAASSRELREALMTEETTVGAKIGSWEIVVENVSDKLKTYDVRNVHTGEAIASQLRLYEAAHALAKLLNAGHGINTSKVMAVLNLEENYNKHWSDAVTFRQKIKRMSHLNESVKLAIAEDRYSEAKSRALKAREQLRELNERL